MRAPGMTYMRMPMLTWSTFVVSALILFAFPPLTVGLVLMMFDRMFGSNFFDVAAGGNTIIWEHLFWIFGHPEVYILDLTSVWHVFGNFRYFFKKKIIWIFFHGICDCFNWFLRFHGLGASYVYNGFGPIANAIFAVATMAIAVPTGIKIFNWLFTMWGGSVKFTVPMLYAVAFIPSFTMGGVTGIMIAAPADYQYHDTYFVVAHFHYVIVGGVVFALLAGLHFIGQKCLERCSMNLWEKSHFGHS